MEDSKKGWIPIIVIVVSMTMRINPQNCKVLIAVVYMSHNTVIHGIQPNIYDVM